METEENPSPNKKESEKNSSDSYSSHEESSKVSLEKKPISITKKTYPPLLKKFQQRIKNHPKFL